MTRKAKVIIVVLAVGLGVPLLLLMGVVGIIALFVLGGLGVGAGESYGNPDEFIFHMDPTPQWSPDGSSIVFGHSDGRIYVVEADGTRLRSISRGSGKYDVDISPSISPDGSRIAYATLRHKTREYRGFEIVTSALDGSDKRRLTENESADRDPVWSPDGSQIAFTRGTGLFVMSSDGSDVRQIVSLGYGVALPPSWSPDGRRLAFVTKDSDSSSSDYIAHIVEIDGTALKSLTRIEETLSPSVVLAPPKGHQYGRPHRAINRPEWSPDGGRMAFARVMENDRMKIYVADTDSSRSIELPVGGRNISWSPDGFEIATESFIVKVDGSSVIDSPSLDDSATSPLFMPWGIGSFVAWSPDGSRIAINVQPTIEGSLPPPVYDSGIQGLPPTSPGVVLYTMNRDGTDRRILVEQNEDGSLSAGNGRFLDDGQIPTTVYFGGAWPSPAPFDIEQCSNGVVVSNPDENPMLVEDCKTLLRIRDSLGANPPLNWRTDISIADWEGIVLGNASVERVQLSDRVLTGVVSPEFGGLSGLQELNLRDNWLGGSIPSELGNLTSLRGLYLDSNELEGEIPSELGNLTSLEELGLSDNRLTSVPEDLAMPNLRSFSLNGNPIEGCIPNDIFAMSRGSNYDSPFEPCGK